MSLEPPSAPARQSLVTHRSLVRSEALVRSVGAMADEEDEEDGDRVEVGLQSMRCTVFVGGDIRDAEWIYARSSTVELRALTDCWAGDECCAETTAQVAATNTSFSTA